MTERPHGTNAKFTLEKCRCTDCHAANRREANNRSRQIAYGRWQPYTDAQPVREHVQQLIAAGINWRRVAQLSGVSTSVVENLLYGKPRLNRAPSRRLRPAAAHKLLALQAGPDKMLTLDAIGFQRRIQALVCNGWSLHRLATELACDRRTLQQALTGQRIQATTDLAGRAVYDRLWRLDPTDHGATANAVSLARGWAVRRGWAPVGCWDDDTIDDPTAFPDWTGHCGTPRGYRVHHEISVPLCEPCRDARNTARRAAYAA